MLGLNAPADVSFVKCETVVNHFKAFINLMNQQCDFHAGKPMARYYSNKSNSYKILTYREVDRMATNLACKWAEYVKDIQCISFMSDHTIDYLITMLALLKLRVTMLAVSPRNSEPAIVNLLEKTKTKLFIANNKYEAITKDVVKQVPGVQLILIDALDINTLLNEPVNPVYTNVLDLDFSDEDIEKSALIIHSSGSTNFPKPIYLSNRYLINILKPIGSLINTKENMPHITEKDVMLALAPLFHIFGIFANFSMYVLGGSSVFVEKLPPSLNEIFSALKDNECTVAALPPLLIEQMIPYLEETNDFTDVQRLKYTFYGGAPLKHESGEWLHAHGVNVRDLYGTTEINAFMTSNLDPKSKHWDSLTPYHLDAEGKSYAVFETNDPSEPHIKHCYIRGDCPFLATNVSNRSDGGYDTNDLFIENPEAPGYWIYLGRRDDTLIMENGEKTNPVPMEATIRQSPMVKQAAVIGQSRQLTCCLVEIDMEYAMHYAPDEVINAVHKAVEKANKDCPSHSTILPQMVKILPFNKSLPSTDKGTLMRKRVEALYGDMIEQLYRNFLEGPARKNESSADTSQWTAEQIEDFLETCAAEVLGIPKSVLAEDHKQSVFDLGLNSLSAIQLRNRISEYFGHTPQNFLFQHPSIAAMREYLMSQEKEDISEQIEKRYQQANQLAKDYIRKAEADFPVAQNDYSNKQDKVILLTGATGSLGSFMLRDLLKDPSVKKVYCCVRGKESELYNRLVQAFDSRALDLSLLKNTDRVEALPMRFNEPFLGFSEEKYNQLKNEVTIIQHCAWLLDFNMPVDHYDKECIAPFYNLLKFAYREKNPMHVHFISSISASAAWDKEIPEEPLPLDSHVTMPMGYAHSKFVVEILFNFLTTERNFPCYIERLGQVCGDSVNGVWNTSEQYPLMFVGGGSIMHKMPALDTVIDWISVDYASATIVDIMLRTAYSKANAKDSIYHIVNPRLVMWSDVLNAMKLAGMKFDVVSPAEWVESLAQDDTNPAYRLISFYETNFKKAFKMPVWKTEKTSTMAPVIQKSPVLDSTLFGKFLARWQFVGFYNPSV
ncbi:hypothetical protein BDF20DRAFT_814613 [Mycotypha africana]|uniref:uncharacterized protein n=1 Tax=Mycotypha africana TaxID=64632 RepID=UPI0023016453|nr:uncharacterized protein BDF20DRAFT_814613 [Mycotypha africana]KAI8987327.1 hypothetical protein BDF20DRAFT_814613 [Mycotypha africana]